MAAFFYLVPQQNALADARFRNLTEENGLPGVTAFKVIQDKQGYIWIATGNGLERYDGYSFKVFRHRPDAPASLSSDSVVSVFQDAQGRLWVGTYGSGLDMYQPETGKFLHNRHLDGDPNTLASNKILCIAADPEGDLLLGTYESGLDVFNPDSHHIRHYTASNGTGLSDNKVLAVFTDDHGNAWIGTRNGLDVLDTKNGTIRVFLNRKGDKADNVIRGISKGPDGELLLATSHGPHTFDPATGHFDEGKFTFDLPNNDVRTAPIIANKLDTDGEVVLGSLNVGLSFYDPSSHSITTFAPELNKPNSLDSTDIFDIYQDRSGLIWIATDAGVEILDPRFLSIDFITPFDLTGKPSSHQYHIEGVLARGQTLLVDTASDIHTIPLDPQPDLKKAKLFTHIDFQKYGLASVLGNYKSGEILVGTTNNYLLELDSQGRLRSRWHIGDIYGPTLEYPRSMVGRGGGPYYIGTFGNGLFELRPDAGTVRRIAASSPTGLSDSDQVETLLQLSPHKLLAGTFRGLFEVDLDSGSSNLVPLSAGEAQPVIQALYADGQGGTWVGTLEGMWRLDFDHTGRMERNRYFPLPSLNNDVQVLAIVPTMDGELWMSNDNSLIRLDPRTGNTLVLGKDQGMPPLEFFSYSHSRTANGWVWFGGQEGIVGFDPTRVRPNKQPPNVIITKLTAYRGNQPVALQLPKAGPLQLSYQYSIVTFELASTDFAAPQANTYSYRLLGFQPDWTQATTARQITFTNLSPGRYRLEVRTANNWGTWSAQPLAFDLVVLPPWWRTWWAYTLYLLVTIGSSIAYVYSLKRKIEREQEISNNLREANEIKSNFVEKLESQVHKATQELRETLQGVNLKNAELEIAQKRAAEGEQIKSQFLANMSHELRTPLTGVLGYTKLLGSTQLNSEQKDYVSTIKHSSETLLAIINDTLDLSRLEAGKLLVDQVDFDLLEVIESTLELLAPTAYQKRLELVRVVPADVPLYLRGDPLRLRQVLTNLISNAIKFTEHGSVAIEVKVLAQDEREARLMFSVSDTGIGIPAGELPKLFHAYARSRISTHHHVEGTGLGLAICKKLLDLMGGDIKVKSKVGTGTSFEFELAFKLQKNAEPRSRLPRKIKVLLYDTHPLSNQAWRACLTRLGAELESATDLESVVAIKADAAIMVLSEKELTQLGELKHRLTPALPPMLILAPRIERQALKDLSEILFHRVLSKTAREKTLYLELQSLLQTVVQDGATAPYSDAASVAPAADAPKILVADDNRINRRLLVTMLNHAGFRVAEAANGLELLDLAAREPWDAALLDIHMPGMDGIDAARKLRESMGDRLPPVIAMSADVMPETRKLVLDGVMDDFMVKPFSEQELVDKLRWHLDRHMRKHRNEIQPT